MTQLCLVIQEKSQLEHSSHIVNAGVSYSLTLQAQTYIEGNYQTDRSIWNYVTGTLNPGKDAKPDCVIQLNWGEVSTHASYKATRTWEKFNNRGTKMILLSGKISITNNSKSFASGSKVIIRNNLGLYKRSDIYLI